TAGLAGSRRFSSCFLDDLDPGTGAYSRSPRGDHGFDAFQVAHASGRFDAHFGADNPPHQGHVRGSRTAGTEARGRLDIVGAGRLGQRARGDLLVVSKKRGFDNDFAQYAALTAGCRDTLDITLDDTEVT